MKRILYLHSSSDMYGSDKSLLRTIRGLDRSKFTPLVCLPYHGPLVEALRAIDVDVFILPLAVLRRSSFGFRGLIQLVFEFIYSFFKILSIVRQQRIDMIHSNTSAVIVGGVVARIADKIHIWHIREIITHPAAVKNFISWCVDRFSTVVVAVSQSVADHLAKDQPSVRYKCRVIHNGLETEEYVGGNRGSCRKKLELRDEYVLVGMIGRISHWKGQDLFVEVAKQIIEDCPTAYFLAVGSAFKGQEYRMREFQETVHRHGLQDRFFIEEFRIDIRDILAALDIFVLPSILPDPFPTTVLEAMAAGKAIVANGHGGVLQMIEDGKSGFIVSPNEKSALCEKINTLILDDSLRRTMGAAAQERVNRLFHVNTYTRNINNLYLQL